MFILLLYILHSFGKILIKFKKVLGRVNDILVASALQFCLCIWFSIIIFVKRFTEYEVFGYWFLTPVVFVFTDNV